MARRQESRTGHYEYRGDAAELRSTLITEELYRRPPREPDYEAENRALVDLARTLAESPGDLLQTLAETTLELCRADSAGVSILEGGAEGGVFRWHAIAGQLAPNIHGTAPRLESPCGLVVERDAPLLFDRPATYFKDLAGAEPPVYENLLVPLHHAGRPVGTVWAVAHNPERKFDAEDARLLVSLSRFASAGYQLARDHDVSEGRYSALINSIDQAYALCEIITDADGNAVDYLLLEVNPAFEKMTGITAGTAVGRTARQLIPDVEDRRVETYGKVALRGESFRFEHRSAGLDRWFEVYAGPVGEKGGGKFALVFADINERKRAEERLRESEALLAAVFEVLPVGVGVMDVGGALVLSNREMRRYIPNGVMPSRDDERHGRWLLQHADGHRAGRQDFPGARAMRGESVLPGVEMLYTQDDGRKVWTRVGAVPLRDGEGRVSGAVAVVTDVDELKRSAEALRESHARTTGILESISDAFYAVDAGFNFTYVNRKAEELWGRSRESLVGKHFWTEFPDAVGSVSYQMHHKVMAERRAAHYEIVSPLIKRWIDVSLYPDARGGLSCYFRDIDERRHVEDALRESEERLRKAVSIETVGVIFLDLEGVIRDANLAFVRMSGYTREAIAGGGVRWQLLTPPEFMGASHRAVEELLTSGESTPYEKQYIRPDGTRWWGLFAGKRLSENEFVEFVIDVTERRELEEALRRAFDELEGRVRERTRELQEMAAELLEEVKERAQAEARVRALLRQLVTVQEEERRRIARELHDTLGQQLTALRLSLDVINSVSGGSERLREQIGRTQGIFDRINSDVDFLAWELRPAALDKLGLDAALQSFVREWGEHFGVEAAYHGFGQDAPRLAPEVETNLYRILQEALHNIHKHAGATRVSVQLQRRDGRAVLVVEDDGRGYDHGEEFTSGAGRGMGLTNMRERAALIGGELEVESAQGTGTTVFIRVPLGGAAVEGEAV